MPADEEEAKAATGDEEAPAEEEIKVPAEEEEEEIQVPAEKPATTKEKAAKEGDEEQPSKGDSKQDDDDDDGAKITANQGNTASGSDFPEPFYDPITKKLFTDPVVLPDGISYERSAIKGKEDAEKAYSNRALKAVIDETVAMSGNSMGAGIKRLQYSMRKTLSQVMDKSLIPCDEYHPLPEVYYCPITFSLIHDPVIDKEGNTFERVAVENWIRVNGTSPLTRTASSVESLYPNHAIKDLLDLEKGKSDESVHPSVRKWKAEKPPEATDPALGGSAVAEVEATAQGGRAPFPTTTAEWEQEQQRRRNQAAMSMAAMVFTVILAFIAVAYLGIFGMLLLLGICVACQSNNNRNQQ